VPCSYAPSTFHPFQKRPSQSFVNLPVARNDDIQVPERPDLVFLALPLQPEPEVLGLGGLPESAHQLRVPHGLMLYG